MKGVLCWWQEVRNWGRKLMSEEVGSRIHSSSGQSGDINTIQCSK